MKINFNNVELYNRSLNYNRYNNSQNTLKYDTKYLSLPKDTVSFQKSSEIPPSAIKYLKQRRKELGESYNNLESYDWKKLEGLQNGIEIFEGLNFPQVAYLITRLDEIALLRGCNNGCIHCYADAKTPFYMKSNHFADKIDFEDYKNLIDGFKEINERLDFNAFNDGSKYQSASLFHDADSSMIYLQDENNKKTYDYADLAKMLYDVTGREILFDTAGWNLNDKNTQKRMEDLVQKIANSNEYDFMQFYTSINPFQKIYNKSVESAEKGDIETAKKLREIYTDRMANVIFTFSPLIDKKNTIADYDMLDMLIRALSYFGTDLSPKLKGYCGNKFSNVCNEIVEKVEKLYTQDLMSDCPKVIKDENQKERYLNKIQDLATDIRCRIGLTNKKLLSKFDKNDSYELEDMFPKRMYDFGWRGINFRKGIIDVNGKFYVTNENETYPTDIVLNYKNKGKNTAPFEPNLRDDIITKEMIERYNESHADT